MSVIILQVIAGKLDHRVSVDNPVVMVRMVNKDHEVPSGNQDRLGPLVGHFAIFL